MKTILISVLVSVAIVAGVWFVFMSPQQNIGVEQPSVVAFFETSLASKITSTATSMTLVSGTDKDGNSISGKFGMVIDEGSSDEEVVIADCSGTTCSNMLRGISVTTGSTEVSALKKAHRRGASVKITDYPIIAILQRLASGSEAFEDHLYYSETLSNAFSSVTASTSAFTPRLYVDAMAASGFTAANINSGDGMQVYGTSPETLGINLASSSGLYFLPTGDLAIYASTSNPIFIDSNGKVSGADNTASWTLGDLTLGNLFGTHASISDDISLTSPLRITSGGLGSVSWDTNDLIYFSADNTAANIASGSDGSVLKMSSGTPQWVAPFGEFTVASSATALVPTNAATYEIPSTVNMCIIQIYLSDSVSTNVIGNAYHEGWIFRTGKTVTTYKEQGADVSQLDITFTGASNVLTATLDTGTQDNYEFSFWCYK